MPWCPVRWRDGWPAMRGSEWGGMDDADEAASGGLIIGSWYSEQNPTPDPPRHLPYPTCLGPPGLSPPMLLWLPLALAAAQQPGGNWSTLQSWNGVRKDATLGAVLSSVGDLDGDGLADVVAGAPDGELALSSFGRGQAVAYSSRTGQVIFSKYGAGSSDGFGAAVAGVGDTDGDGVPDVLVGTRLFDNGYVRLFSGATGAILAHIPAPPGADGFGWSLAPAGDLDADGHADFIIGVRAADPGGIVNAGSVVVYSGLSLQPILTIDGGVSNLFLGKAVAGGGDANGDGTPDILAQGNGLGTGSVHLFSGATGLELSRHDGVAGYNVSLGHALAFLGDLDLDGADDYIISDQYCKTGGGLTGGAWVHSGLTGGLLWKEYGAKADMRYGSAVAALGDVNGDGSPDFAVGASRETRQWSATHTGTAWVYSGADFMCLQIAPGDYPVYQDVFEFGAALAGVGDADGDGRGDLAVGAPGTNAMGMRDHGRVYLYAFDSRLVSSSPVLSTGQGGHWSVTVDFPSDFAGRSYVFLPSPVDPTSDRDENWFEWQGVPLPLIDSRLARIMFTQTPPGWYNTHGVLDAEGNAVLGLNAAPGALLGFTGSAIRFAAVVAPSGPLEAAGSGAVTLRLLP